MQNELNAALDLPLLHTASNTSIKKSITKQHRYKTYLCFVSVLKKNNIQVISTILFNTLASCLQHSSTQLFEWLNLRIEDCLRKNILPCPVHSASKQHLQVGLILPVYERLNDRPTHSMLVNDRQCIQRHGKVVVLQRFTPKPKFR